MVSALVLATVVAATAMPGRLEGDVPAQADGTRGTFSSRVREEWVLSVEGVTRVPIDAGAQVGFETPFGLRVFAGYGWVPYVGMLTGIVVSASDRNVVTAFLDGGRVTGDSARLSLGVRPFQRLGVYFDASYAHLRLAASTTVPAESVQGFEFAGGSYDARTGVDLWGAELGYEGEVAGRLVLGAAAGISGAIDSQTTITPGGSAPNDPALTDAARRVDHAFRTHVLPTVTLRLGFDAI